MNRVLFISIALSSIKVESADISTNEHRRYSSSPLSMLRMILHPPTPFVSRLCSDPIFSPIDLGARNPLCHCGDLKGKILSADEKHLMEIFVYHVVEERREMLRNANTNAETNIPIVRLEIERKPGCHDLRKDGRHLLSIANAQKNLHCFFFGIDRDFSHSVLEQFNSLWPEIASHEAKSVVEFRYTLQGQPGNRWFVLIPAKKV